MGSCMLAASTFTRESWQPSGASVADDAPSALRDDWWGRSVDVGLVISGQSVRQRVMSSPTHFG